MDAGGLSPAKEKRAKSTEKTYLPDVRALVNRRYLRRIEHGAANPTINELSRIAEALGAEFRNPIHIPELPDAAQRSGGSDKP